MTCIYISSTILWLLIIAIAIVFTRTDSDTTFVNSLFTIVATIIWITVALRVGRPYWPIAAFALLVVVFFFELFLDTAILYGQ